ncbi:MAG: TIGR00645 family protein [Dokdonella sp.]|uniref:TIGR00645 family protein n=1 Tax=Dokdonella sp. TaxID=2291710 RepID=UPI0025C62802|nr:TIGR00645 family protein [Dokdonella sp.]MBX3700256.1 TIGR00645 family protein [Dokdonella sp.]MCW5577015.1 TIGR00645 family protein [Dokdonella sp.]
MRPGNSPIPNLAPMPALIFSARWLQLPLYLGLILAQGVYVFLFLKELWHLLHDAFKLSEQSIMLIVLGLIDVVMISNLLIMVIVGGYETFVSRLRLEQHPDQPEWLSHVNASVLKVKLAMAIIGISSIHLLKTFIEVGALGGLPFCEPALLAQLANEAAVGTGKQCTTLTTQGVMWQTIIHCVFILSAAGIAWTDRLMSGLAARHQQTAEAH